MGGRGVAGARPTMPVAERFVSINGEGVRAGRLAAFVRFAGCNLACSYCDTRWVNEPDCPVDYYEAGAIAAWARSTGAACVTLTGGEPLLQPQLCALVRALLDDDGESPALGGGKSPVSFVEIETNGAVDVTDVARLRKELGERGCGHVGLTMDYKLPSSGMERAMLCGNFSYLTSDDTVKFVAGSPEDLDVALRVMREHDLCGRCAVYLSPVFGELGPSDLVDFVRDNRLADVTVQLQMHKIIWPDAETGV